MRKEIKKNSLRILVLLILVAALFLRVYRVNDLLGFYFDQGRDALVIWRLLHEGKFFLIGPVTGIEGIFLGPLYYYLIAPFYLIGGGNPVVPAIFLAILSTLAVPLIYLLGGKLHSKEAGIFASIIFAFSYYLVSASRWLANPTPLLLVSLLLVWSMWEIIRGRRWLWLAASLLVGISLQLEAASAFFYLPTVFLFAIWQKKNLPDIKTGILSVFLFLATLVPQILFDLRHHGVLWAAVQRFLIEEGSFRLSFWEVVKLRLPFYLDVFETNILPGWRVFFIASLVTVLGILTVTKKLLTTAVMLLLLVITVPLIGLLFFQGNYGNIWGYYLTGIYLPFVLLFSIGLAELWRQNWKLLVLVFFTLFFVNNGILLGGPTTIPFTFADQKEAIDWIYQDAGQTSFNVDVYVPPVIPYAYDYLFLWWGTTRYGKIPEVKEQVPLLYTLYEVDPPHPERLLAWLERQKGIGVIEKETQFGGITVQRRTRL